MQLAVRLPAPLRAQVHRAAAASGCPSTQAWLHDVIAGAVANELDPQRRAARRVHEVLIDRLTEQVDAGHYEAVVAELGLEDPELA